MRSAFSLSLAVLFMGLSLFDCSRQADENTPGSPGATGEVDPYLNSQERMEERNNNSSVIIESDRANQ